MPDKRPRSFSREPTTRRNRFIAIALTALCGLTFSQCRRGLGRAESAPPQWIGPAQDATSTDKRPAPILRRSFRLEAKPRGGTIRVVGLGHYRLSLNGQAVGDGVINQVWSQYDKTLYVQEFDISGLLRKGENVFGVSLGNSFWHVVPTEDPAR